MRRLALAVALVAAGLGGAACGDNHQAPAPDPADHDAAVEPGDDAGPTPDAAPDAGAALTPCLDHPDHLDRPPTAALPCDLLPPGLQP